MDKYFKKIDSTLERNENTNTFDDENICETSVHEETPPKKIKKSAKYLKSWETDELLKSWISKSKNNMAYCKICAIELKIAGGIKDLKNHAQSAKHILKCKAVDMHQNTKVTITAFSTHKNEASKAELQIAAFCAEHNISFNTMDHLIPMLKNAIPDSNILKTLSCGRTKTSALIKNVIGKGHSMELCELIKENYFSLCADESTDISTTKLLSLTVRTQLKDKIYDFFFALIKIQQSDALSIYNKITEAFLENNIIYKKYLIGFAADGANVMTGANHSVATLLKKDCPHLIIFKCTCHSFALCANHACKYLPKFVESCTRDIYNFIQNSPKRIELFTELQILLDCKPRKMLHPSATRWLSLEATVNQILSRFDILRLFFAHEDIEKFDVVQRIKECFNKPEFELYLKFLKFILNDINKLNRLFQSESPQLHILHSEISRLYLKIFEYFVKDQFVSEQFLKIQTLNQCFMKDLKDIYLGADVSSSLETTHKLGKDNETEFRSNCLKFYIELTNQLLKKFDFGDTLLEGFGLLSPVNVIQKANRSISNLLTFFPNIINQDEYQNIDDEWREVRLLNFQQLLLSEQMEIDNFWYSIFELKRANGEQCFPNLKKIIMAILSIPVATANVERIFSQININKTKLRNKLEPATLSGILFTKDYMKKKGNNCINFEPNKNMNILFNKEMYK